MTNPRAYSPLDCSLHDRLESIAILRTVSRIVYRTAEGERVAVDDRIKDIVARDGIEYVHLAGGAQVRLDDLLEVDGTPFRPTAPTYRRLKSGDTETARAMFAVVADVFEEPSQPLDDAWVGRLLASPSFVAIAAFVGDDIVGGVTAHVLPMTRTPSHELFIYDIAVRADWQRQGIGAGLIESLREAGKELGITDVFVAADDEDVHALDFYRAIGGDGAAVTIFTFSER